VCVSWCRCLAHNNNLLQKQRISRDWFPVSLDFQFLLRSPKEIDASRFSTHARSLATAVLTAVQRRRGVFMTAFFLSDTAQIIQIVKHTTTRSRLSCGTSGWRLRGGRFPHALDNFVQAGTSRSASSWFDGQSLVGIGLHSESLQGCDSGTTGSSTRLQWTDVRVSQVGSQGHGRDIIVVAKVAKQTSNGQTVMFAAV